MLFCSTWTGWSQRQPAAGALYACGVLLSPAVGAVLMSLCTVIVAVNARFLKIAS